MNRSSWLREKQRLSEYRYDTLHASSYDKNWGHINASHKSFLQRFLALCPPACTILDAACGTGKYWPLILESGRVVVGTDQPQQMLLQAQSKFPNVETKKVSLQEIDFTDAFDGVICMDAMEFVAPEDWSFVLNNFHATFYPSSDSVLALSNGFFISITECETTWKSGDSNKVISSIRMISVCFLAQHGQDRSW